MSYSRILEARQAGPARLSVHAQTDTEVTGSDAVDRITILAWTNASDGPTVELIDGLTLRERAGVVELRMPKSAETADVVIGNGIIKITGNATGMINSFGSGGSYSRVEVNGTVYEIHNGRTYVNGALVTNAAAAKTGSGLQPVFLRITVPPGSTAEVSTHNGDITCADVDAVRLDSHNGSLKATGLRDDSSLSTHNGKVSVSAAAGCRPVVSASTHNGDIRVLDDDIRVRPRTHNGTVRYPK